MFLIFVKNIILFGLNFQIEFFFNFRLVLLFSPTKFFIVNFFPQLFIVSYYIIFNSSIKIKPTIYGLVFPYSFYFLLFNISIYVQQIISLSFELFCKIFKILHFYFPKF